MQVKRSGVSLEEYMLNVLDKLFMRNQSPKQAIRCLIKSTLVMEKWAKNKIVEGAIVTVYDHYKRELSSKLINVQQNFHDLILFTQHVHLVHDFCLETIAVKGGSREFIKLADRILTLKELNMVN